MANNEHQFESDIESLMTGELGWEKANETGYLKTRELALDLETLLSFVKTSQPKTWAAFEKSCAGLDPEKEFYKKFENAVGTDGMIDVLRNGFHANGRKFRVCFFKPENKLNATALADYEKNICQFIRQWHYSVKDGDNVMLFDIHHLVVPELSLITYLAFVEAGLAGRGCEANSALLIHDGLLSYG